MQKRFKHTYLWLAPQGFVSCKRAYNRMKCMHMLHSMNPLSDAYEYWANKLSRVYLTWWTQIY